MLFDKHLNLKKKFSAGVCIISQNNSEDQKVAPITVINIEHVAFK